MALLVRPQVEQTLGALLLGNLAAAIFYGITCVQACVYYRKKYKDSVAFKLLIFFLWFLDGLHLALISHASYHYMVLNFKNISAIAIPTWTILAHAYVTIIIDNIIRAIFARRVWLISKRNIVLVSCIVVTSSLGFVAAFTFITRALIRGTFESFSQMSYLIYIGFGGGTVTDVLIATSLCFALPRKRTACKNAGSVIGVLMMYVINTCLLTTMCSLACLITYAVWPTTFIFLGILYLLSKLYYNSLLAALNSREDIRERLNDDDSTPKVNREGA